MQAILASRIDRLEPEHKRLLQTASVIGKDLPLAPLSAVADLPEPDLRRALARLQAAEFLYETSLFPEPEYTFKHALTHEVAYASLLHEQRRALHARVGEVLVLLYANRLAEHTERLAFHTFRGEVWEKAAQYAFEAGRRAGERATVREVGRYGEQGLEALARLPSNRERLELSLHLRQLVYHTFFTVGESERMVAWAEESVAVAEERGNQPWLARAKNTLANSLWFIGQNAQALQVVEEAQVLAEAIGDTKTRITTALDIGQICRTLGDYRRGADAAARATHLLQGDLVRDRLDRAFYPFVTLRTNVAGSLAELGEFRAAINAGREAITFTETVQQPGTLVSALIAVTTPLLAIGEFKAAIPNLERAARISKSGYTSLYPFCAARLGHAYAMDGRHSEAVVLVDEALTLAPIVSPRNEVAVMLSSIEAYVSAGRLQNAFSIAGKALERARGGGERGSEARVRYLLAELRSASDLHQAMDDYREALALADILGMRPLIAHCRLGMARLYQRTGKVERAREQFEAAATMYQDMGMQYWLQKTERELVAVACE